MTRRLYCSFLLSLAMPLVSCRSTRSSSETLEAPTSDASLAAAQALVQEKSVRDFRNIFIKLARSHGYKDEEIQKMIFLPTKEQLGASQEALDAKTAPDTVDALQRNLARFSTTSIYEHAQATAYNDPGDIEALFQNVGPATIIIVPGIFGEFLNITDQDYPFSGAFAKSSRFRQQYQAALAGVKDKAFDLTQLREIDTDMSERVQLGSLDDKSGHSHVQVIYLNAVWGSTESLGDIQDVASVNLRRLNKAFSKIPLEQCKNIYLMGYSRGLPVALEMVTQAFAKSSDYPFLAQLKGVISLAGVNHGTAVADDAMANPASPTFKILQSLRSTLDEIQVHEKGEGYISASGKELKNGVEIFQFALDAAKIQGQVQMPEGLANEAIKSEDGDPFFILQYALKVLDSVTPNPANSAVNRLENLKRARLLLSKMLEGAAQLQTAARNRWWAEHLIPEQLSYYSIAGAMAEVSRNGFVSPLLDSPYYGTTTLDYKATLRQGAYNLYDLTKVSQNDSQVVESATRFWPELASHFNPRQKPYRFYHMGVLGTHHWGLSFPVAIKHAGGLVNPFPREVLLEAMGAYLLREK